MDYKQAIQKYFPGAMHGRILTDKVNMQLEMAGFRPENTLFGNSTCPDEINRFVTNFGDYWGENFPLGGLAGFPFTGKTGFAAFSHHIEHGSNLFILYASHVGVTREGVVGKVLRKRMGYPTTSCGSAIGAYNSLCGHSTHSDSSPSDYQQSYVTGVVKKHLDEINEADEPMAKLSYVIFEEIKDWLRRVIPPEYHGNIALLGGIQINTMYNEPSYFLPLEFRIINPAEHKDIDLLAKLA